MKAYVNKVVEVEIKTVVAVIDVSSMVADGDLDSYTPLLGGSIWELNIDIDTGKISDWPCDRPMRVPLLVRDTGTYRLIDIDGEIVGEIVNGYVPNDVIPGAYGEIIELDIDCDGFVTNWPDNPSLSEFFGGDPECCVIEL